jgi:cytochrome bd-type quinol oxidase subunit 2
MNTRLTLSDDAAKWAKGNLIVGVCVLIGTLVMIGATIYGAAAGAPGSSNSAAGQAFEAIEIVLVLCAGALAILAFRMRTKLVVCLNASCFAFLTLLVLIGLIVLLAGPTLEATQEMVDAACQLRNLQPEQCDVLKQFTLIGVYLVQAATLCYCLCYTGVALLYVRAIRADTRATVVRTIGADSYSGAPANDGEGFDDFPAAEKVPMLNVSANVI